MLNIYSVIIMQLTLNPDDNLVEWKAFREIIDLVDSRFFSQELTRNGFKKIYRYRILFKVLFLAMFSQYDISEIVRQINRHSKLRKFCKIEDKIDYSAGIILLKKPGDHVDTGDILAYLHTSDSTRIYDAEHLLASAYKFDTKPPPASKTILAVVSDDGVKML